MNEILGRILEEGIIPVIRVASSDEALNAARALRDGGMSILEITMTVSGADDVIRESSRTLGDDVFIGAGTVLDAEAARAALDAGASFLVSPGIRRKVIEVARERKAVVIPGALTPTEILAAWEAGADLVKVFPATPAGGPAFIRALRGPLPHIPLVPTGGVNLQNIGDYIRAGASAVGVGGELVDKKALAEKSLSLISEMAGKFLDDVRAARALE